jgi:hypothetical protein
MAIKMFDFFISYKSEDSHIVRQIVDQMIGSGLKVWFFEYQEAVFYDDIAEIDKAVLEGIKNSKKGICFTSDAYVIAKPCILEMDALISQKGVENIIEVQMPEQHRTDQKYAEFANALSVKHQSINQTLEFIEKISGKKINRQKLSKTKSNRIVFRDYIKPYSLDLGGWNLGKSRVKGINNDINGAWFGYTGSDFKMSGQLTIGPMTIDTSRNSYLNKENKPDERKFFSELKKSGLYGFCRNWGVTCFGGHLYFLPNTSSWSQYGLTSRARLFLLFLRYNRKYSVVLPVNDKQPDIEFHFDFLFNGSLSNFHQHTYLMDSVVQSLRWV